MSDYSVPPPPPPVPPAPPKKRPAWIIPVGIVGGVLILCCVVASIAVALIPSGGTPHPTAAAGQLPPSPTAKPTATPIHWVTIEHLTGNGNETTQTIPLVGVNISQEWRLSWTCDPTSVGLNVNVLYPDGSPADFNAVNTDCSSGHTSGNAVVRGVSGNIVLNIISQSFWTVDIQVQGLP